MNVTNRYGDSFVIDRIYIRHRCTHFRKILTCFFDIRFSSTDLERVLCPFLQFGVDLKTIAMSHDIKF